MKYRLTTLRQHPRLAASYGALVEKCWPIFMYYHQVARKYSGLFTTTFTQHQVLYRAGGQLIAAGNMLPIVWDGTLEGLPAGWDAALAQVAREHEQERSPTALMAAAVIVDPQYQRQGISSTILRAMRKNAVDHGFQRVIAPVRPTWKSRYPFVPMQEYIGWTRENGEPFDPWIRVHARLGGKILTVAPRSMVIKGSVVEWEAWTGIRMPGSGAYAVPGALHPVIVDYEKNEGLYEEPNVWMVHSITAEEHTRSKK